MIWLIKFSTAVVLWGYFIFVLHRSVDFLIRWANHYSSKDFRRLREYLYACIDALFFILPDLAILHGHNENIIDDISNNSWWIVFLTIDIVITFWILPYNFMSIIKTFVCSNKKILNKEKKTKKYMKIYNRELYLFIGCNIIFTDISLFCVRSTNIIMTILDFVICWIIEIIIVHKYRHDINNFKTVPLVRKSEWQVNNKGDLIPKPLICIPYEKHIHNFKEHEYLKHLEVLGIDLTIISLVSIKFISCLLVMLITYTYFIECTDNEKTKTL